MAVNSTDIEIIKHNDISIYSSDIQLLTEEYISTLDNPEMIYKSLVFSGLLEYIYSHLLTNILPDNNKPNDYDLLNKVFYGVYIKLCYRFNINPTIIGFSVFTHIDNTNLSDIKNGIYRSNGNTVNYKTSQLVKNWYTVCESGLVGKVADSSSIGSMFLLKSVYGYSDNQTITIQQNDSLTHETAEQIAARHQNAALPEKIDL